MHRQPHDSRDDMKVWLSRDEVDLLLEFVEDTTRRIAVALGVRCGLRSDEIVHVRPVDVVDGPAGQMLRVREEGAKGDQYRETPIPPLLARDISAVADLRDDLDDGDELVDVTTRTLRNWVDDLGGRLATDQEDDGWRDLSPHDFRRTWATLLAGAEGVDPLLVCDWGGWNDLETFLDHYRGTYSPEVQRRARDGVEWL